MRTSYTIGKMLLIALFALGCNLTTPAAPVDDTLTEELTPIPTPKTTQPAWPDDWQLFVDDIGGVAFAFPQSWSIIPVSEDIRRQGTGYTYTLASFDQQTAPGRDGIPEGSTKVDISIGAFDVMFRDDYTLEQVANYATTSDGVQEVLEQTAITLPDGAPAIKIRLIGRFGDEFTSYIMKIGDTGVSVGGLGADMALVEQIAMTLHAA
ncbi:MAG: hypothetical protein H6670_12935 [Anaerolineaceae bacterium]|nr:hypothetical protein [Anaerolineaceae bacterium]